MGVQPGTFSNLRALTMKLKTRIGIPVSLLVFVVLIFLFKNAGSWIVDTDSPSSGGPMLVLMGSVKERSVFAAKYYQAHQLSDVYVVKAGIDEKKVPQASRYLQYVKQMKEGLQSGGIDSSDIHFITDEARSTLDEAHAMAKYCAERKIDKLCVITSTYHTRRAKIIFADVFASKGLTTRLIFPFNTESRFDFKSWYRSAEDRRTTGRELIKLAYYYLWTKWMG